MITLDDAISAIEKVYTDRQIESVLRYKDYYIFTFKHIHAAVKPSVKISTGDLGTFNPIWNAESPEDYSSNSTIVYQA